MKWRTICVLLAVAATAITALLPGSASAARNPVPAAKNPGFVTRSGSQLELDGKPFRFSGANIDWLGLIGYGPHNWEPGETEQYPSDYEINDALATAKEMGANVVRAQTLGDTVGCPNCLEPEPGQFNQRAFRVMDYAVMRARYYGIRLIFEFVGDSRAVNGGETSSVFSSWAGGADPFTDPTAIGDEEALIRHVVDHVNTYTGISNKDDPAILGWMDCNACSLDSGFQDSWVNTISSYVKSLDPRHLFISNAYFEAPDTTALSYPDVDAYSTEIYPHWYPLLGGQAQGASPRPLVSPDQAALATQFTGQAVGYSRTGNPTVAGAPIWTRFTSGNQNVMTLVPAGDKDGHPARTLSRRCKFSPSVPAATRSAPVGRLWPRRAHLRDDAGDEGADPGGGRRPARSSRTRPCLNDTGDCRRRP